MCTSQREKQNKKNENLNTLSINRNRRWALHRSFKSMIKRFNTPLSLLFFLSCFFDLSERTHCIYLKTFPMCQSVQAMYEQWSIFALNIIDFIFAIVFCDCAFFDISFNIFFKLMVSKSIRTKNLTGFDTSRERKE